MRHSGWPATWCLRSEIRLDVNAQSGSPTRRKLMHAHLPAIRDPPPRLPVLLPALCPNDAVAGHCTTSFRGTGLVALQGELAWARVGTSVGRESDRNNAALLRLDTGCCPGGTLRVRWVTVHD